MSSPTSTQNDKLHRLEKGDLVVYSDQETMPQWANNYGIVVKSSHNDDGRLCAVWWHGDDSPTLHYKYELKIITKEGLQYGEYILGRG